VNVHSFPRAEQIARQQRPGEPYDLGLEAWVADPFWMLDQLVRGGSPSNYGRFDGPLSGS